MNLNIPLLNQLTEPDNNDTLNCGPESARMVARYLGIIEPVRQIKGEETGSPDFVGYTSAIEMANWFMNRGIPATALQVTNVPGYIKDSLSKGFPCIYLRWWDINAQTGGHFVVPIGYNVTTDIFTINNPWGGVVDQWTSTQIQNNSQYGWVVEIQKSELNILDLLTQQWRSRKTDVAVNPNAAIFKDWLSKRQSGDYSLGVPVTEEFSYNGGTAQIFTNAIGVWNAASGVTWK